MAENLGSAKTLILSLTLALDGSVFPFFGPTGAEKGKWHCLTAYHGSDYAAKQIKDELFKHHSPTAADAGQALRQISPA